MKALSRTMIAGLASAGLALCGAVGAAAQSTPLADAQLDSVTAGGVTVGSLTGSSGAGSLVITGTTANTIAVHGASSNPGQPFTGISAGLADGTAVAVGTNVGLAQEPTSASTNVQTGGVADGNFQYSSTVNQTLQGPGGVQATVGWTFAAGAFIGL
jgi:hypothetical protein